MIGRYINLIAVPTPASCKKSYFKARLIFFFARFLFVVFIIIKPRKYLIAFESNPINDTIKLIDLFVPNSELYGITKLHFEMFRLGAAVARVQTKIWGVKMVEQ